MLDKVFLEGEYKGNDSVTVYKVHFIHRNDDFFVVLIEISPP